MIKVSIIVPVYNVENYLVKCLDSLVHQTLKDIEIIVVNDGSPDNSQNIIDTYVKKYPKIVKSYIKENGGLGSARNYGLKQAQGEYILFVDSDDYIAINMAEELYNNAIKNNSDVVVCGDNLVAEDYHLINKENGLENNRINNNLLKYKLAVWNKLYKKDLLISNNLEFRSNVWYEDVDYTTKIMLLTTKISYIDKPLYNYLLRNGSIMNNSNLERNKELILSFKEIINFCIANDLYEKYYSEIEYLAIYNMYICGITRILRTKNKRKDKMIIINEYKNYLINNFPHYRKNKYLKDLNINKKIIYHLLNMHMYSLIILIFKIK